MLQHGYCPTLQQENSVDIEYIKSSFIAEETQTLKGQFTCNYASHGGKCEYLNECPIYKSAPSQL